MAQYARGSILLFIHADTLLPARGLDHVAEKMHDPKVAGGVFARRYASPSLFLRATCFLAQYRNRAVGWHLGGQAMFVRGALFFQLSGFRDVQMFEDLDFSRRLKQLGEVATLSPGVTSSARRFQNGAARTTLRDLRLTIAYLFNGPPLESQNSGVPVPQPDQTILDAATCD